MVRSARWRRMDGRRGEGEGWREREELLLQGEAAPRRACLACCCRCCRAASASGHPKHNRHASRAEQRTAGAQHEAPGTRPLPAGCCCLSALSPPSPHQLQRLGLSADSGHTRGAPPVRSMALRLLAQVGLVPDAQRGAAADGRSASGRTHEDVSRRRQQTDDAYASPGSTSAAACSLQSAESVAAGRSTPAPPPLVCALRSPWRLRRATARR
jgi:hypothetical protein